jgi:hypothetical protein
MEMRSDEVEIDFKRPKRLLTKLNKNNTGTKTKFLTYLTSTLLCLSSFFSSAT